jgi:hypothetical protein
VGLVDDLLGRRPERVHEQLHARVRERHLDLAGPLLVDAESRGLHRRALEVLGHRRDVVLVEEVLDELPVLDGDHRLEAREARLRAPALPDVLRRHDDVDAVRTAVDVLVDPVELDLELVGRVRQRAEHAQAPRLADRGDDVATVREGEDRELDPERLTDRCAHGSPPLPGPGS